MDVHRDLHRMSRWRMAAWMAAALLLLLPLIAMQFTDEVNWSLGDFVLAGVLLFGSLGIYELATRLTGNAAYRGGVGLAIAATVLLVWVNGAVGIVGAEDSDANRMYVAVLVLGLVGAFIARFRAGGMALAMVATALGLAVVAVIAVASGAGSPAEVLTLTGFFVALFAGSAWLFRAAAQSEQGDVA